VLDDAESRNSIIFVPEIIGLNDTFPMVGHRYRQNVEGLIQWFHYILMAIFLAIKGKGRNIACNLGMSGLLRKMKKNNTTNNYKR
jgi:hypothetical protein